MISYKLNRNILSNEDSSVTKFEDSVFVGCTPFDPANTDYQAYLKWLEEGNTPEPADPIPEPLELTPQQKLENAGLSVDELKQLLGIK